MKNGKESGFTPRGALKSLAYAVERVFDASTPSDEKEAKADLKRLLVDLRPLIEEEVIERTDTP